MKAFFFVLSLLLALAPLNSQSSAWPPSGGRSQMPLWPGTVPDPRLAAASETLQTETKEPVAGRPWLYISNVSHPTLTVYSPRGANTGAAVVVIPGGGYQILAIDLEGTEVCDWLTSKGVTCVLLKYRVPDSGPAWHNDCQCHIHPVAPTALEDAQRTVGLVRFHAAEWHIDPHKIGVLGFSAGGHIVANISTHFAQRSYKPVDAADKLSCRPDFAVAVYPGHLWLGESSSGRKQGKGSFALNPNIGLHITRQTPPTFLLQNEDDTVDGVEQSLSYYAGLKKAGVPVEMHLYAQGGHAFGLRPTKLPVSRWPQLVETWMATIGMIPQ